MIDKNIGDDNEFLRLSYDKFMIAYASLTLHDIVVVRKIFSDVCTSYDSH